MKLKWVELDNIRSYVRERVEFPEGSILLAGDVGSGKSTVLYAFEFGLFGIQRGGLDGGDMLRHGANTGNVSVCFDIGGKDVMISRTLKRDKKGGVTQDSGWVQVNGSRTSLTASEMRARVLELLGYPAEYLTKNPILFRYTVYTPQDEMKRILLVDAVERLGILRRTLGVDKYGRVRENSETILREMRSRRRELVAMTSDIDAKKAELRRRTDEVERLGDEIRENKIAQSSAITEKKKAEETVADIDNKMSAVRAAKERAASLDSTVRQLSARISQIDSDISRFSKDADATERGLGPVPEKPTDKTLAEITSERRGWEQKKGSAVASRSVLEAEAKKLRSILERGVCETCRQRVADTQAFTSEIKKIVGECEKLSAQAIEAEKNKEECERLSAELIVYSKKNDGRAAAENDIKRLRERCEELADEKVRAAREKEDAESERARLSADIGRFPMLEQELKAARDFFRAAQEKEYSIGREIARLESAANAYTRDIMQLGKEIADKEKMKGQIAKLDNVSSWIEQTFVLLVGEMEKAVMFKVQESFNDVFQNWFSVLMGNENLSVSVNEEFSPSIEQNTYQTEYGNLSGGEKTAVALAYRLALNKVINGFVETIRTKDIIILDEPTDGFSGEQVDRIRDVLDELNLGQMIVVSHDPKIDTFVEHVIRFHKEGHSSRVVR